MAGSQVQLQGDSATRAAKSSLHAVGMEMKRAAWPGVRQFSTSAFSRTDEVDEALNSGVKVQGQLCFDSARKSCNFRLGLNVVYQPNAVNGLSVEKLESNQERTGRYSTPL